ncbi:hypothetical protein [Streptomyces bauhiniae]|uniref:Uncharacterized protein n=1 Tax=Streptomyces bauhiniae TaxID=2340725 RepID=A0A7K3QRI3_9ACTN|nr:hypothetical protein [Streptomyces bauhiniae]NEB92390.1 hypothetical protein [Streptomyces bauhiniae]
MTHPISHLDVSLPVVEADIRLHNLLNTPPAGHTPSLQPGEWYERVFDAMACAHPEACTCNGGAQ